MKTCAIILLLSVSWPATLTSKGAEPPERTNAIVISTDLINQLANEARTNNPGLRAASSRVNAASLNAESVRTWEDPMGMFGGSVYSDRGFKPSEDGDLAYGLEQKLPLWGKPTLNRRVAQAEVSMLSAEADYRWRQVRAEITKALLMTALAEHVVEIGEQDLAWLETAANTAENKYRAGQAVVADTLQVQNEVAKRRDTLRTERLQLAHQRVGLNRLLNRKVNSPWSSMRLPPVGPAIPYSERLLSLAVQNEPKLKVLEQEIKQAEASAVLSRRSRLPDVSLGVEGRQYSGDGEFRSGMFTLRFSLPWLNEGKYRKDYQRDKEKQKSAEQEREEQILMVKEELHHLTVGIEATRREALLYQDEISIRANEALSSRLSDWESGRGMFRDVLDARRMLLDSQLMAARATSEQNQSLAELLLWTGLENIEALTPLANESAIIIHDETTSAHHE